MPSLGLFVLFERGAREAKVVLELKSLAFTSKVLGLQFCAAALVFLV